jgi:hypothetical protein
MFQTVSSEGQRCNVIRRYNRVGRGGGSERKGRQGMKVEDTKI